MTLFPKKSGHDIDHFSVNVKLHFDDISVSRAQGAACLSIRISDE